MKVLVTGGYGQLGTAVSEELKRNNIEYIAVGRNDFDITDMPKTIEEVKRYNPDVVIHCAAYTKVDMAECEKELCRSINVDGTYNIALACKNIGSTLLYVSTDYVFSGEKEGFYEVYDETQPINFYGETKLEGENIIKEMLGKFFIVRISWLFGDNGTNFVKTMLKLSNEKKEVAVIEDQIGSPTFTKDLAKLFISMIHTDRYGIYHATNEGICSWAEFAEEIFLQANKNVNVRHISSAEYVCKAKRPKNSRLSKKTLIDNNFEQLPFWKDSLRNYILNGNFLQ